MITRTETEQLRIRDVRFRIVAEIDDSKTVEYFDQNCCHYRALSESEITTLAGIFAPFQKWLLITGISEGN